MSKVSLKRYFDVQLKAIKKAVKVARKEMAQKLALLNEIRGTLEDQAETFVNKTEFNRIAEDVKMLREWKSNIAGRNSIVIFIALASLIVSIIAIFVK